MPDVSSPEDLPTFSYTTVTCTAFKLSLPR